MTRRHHVVASCAAVLAMALTACSSSLPDSVVGGTTITVGWQGELSSANATASPTAGNVDIAEAIRSGFGDVVDGEFVADEDFGTVTIVEDDPFTVRYDLAEPSWSDGIPVDAADLMLGWAGSSGHLGQDSGAADAVASEIPSIDEFSRAIEVTFSEPVEDWQEAVPVPVPAHVVGRLAFGLDDPMEAKQTVIAAIQDQDAAALEKIAAVWDDGFQISEDTDASDDVLLSNGPYVVGGIDYSDEGQTVTLTPNAEYTGSATPQVERIELVPAGDDPVSDVGDSLDVVQVSPTASNQDAVHELERQDFTVASTHDGTLWALRLNPAGVFTGNEVRAAFIHAAPAADLLDGGAGAWASSYTATNSMVAAPESAAYGVVDEDSGFTDALGTAGGDAEEERTTAGVADGTRVCVLYDRTSEFAAGAFAALEESAGEAGWNVVDCGSDDIDAALAAGGWDAAIARTEIPQDSAQIQDQWGSDGDDVIAGYDDPARDALIAQLARTTDVYESREVLAQIEATIVDAAVALPIAVNLLVTIADRDVSGVAPRNGAGASLTADLAQWSVVS